MGISKCDYTSSETDLWMCNYIHVKQWDGITHLSPNFNSSYVKSSLKLENGWALHPVSNNPYQQWMCLDIHALISVRPRYSLLNFTAVDQLMIPSSNGNNFRVTGPLCEEFTGHRWIPLTKASDAELRCFLWSAPWINGWVNNLEAGNLRRHRTHYDVIVMYQMFSRGKFVLECVLMVYHAYWRQQNYRNELV